MDIKAELRLIREKCPNVWKRLKLFACPARMGLVEDDCTDFEHCKEYWDKAIEEEVK